MLRTKLGVALVVASVSLAMAAPVPSVPRSSLAGRERQQLLEGPLDRFAQPGPFVVPPVIDAPRKPKKKAKKK